MSEKVSIFVESAPKPFGNFAQVVKLGNTVHISGQLPIDLETGRLVSNDVGEQSKVVLKYLTAIMQSCAGQVSNILSTRIYLVDLRDHGAYDKVSKEVFYFTPPTRTVIAVAALPFGARIMIDATAELVPIEIKSAGLM
jgi:2-iminobutanoate/2-iminopropanoate deaminase